MIGRARHGQVQFQHVLVFPIFNLVAAHAFIVSAASKERVTIDFSVWISFACFKVHLMCPVLSGLENNETLLATIGDEETQQAQ